MTNNVLETIKKELRGIVRDKKSLLMMIVTPLMIPVFIFIFSLMYNDMMYSEEVDIYNVGVNYTLNSIEEELVKEAVDNLNTIRINYEDKKHEDVL